MLFLLHTLNSPNSTLKGMNMFFRTIDLQSEMSVEKIISEFSIRPFSSYAFTDGLHQGLCLQQPYFGDVPGKLERGAPENVSFYEEDDQIGVMLTCFGYGSFSSGWKYISFIVNDPQTLTLRKGTRIICSR